MNLGRYHDSHTNFALLMLANATHPSIYVYTHYILCIPIILPHFSANSIILSEHYSRNFPLLNQDMSYNVPGVTCTLVVHRLFECQAFQFHLNIRLSGSEDKYLMETLKRRGVAQGQQSNGHLFRTAKIMIGKRI